MTAEPMRDEVDRIRRVIEANDAFRRISNDDGKVLLDEIDRRGELLEPHLSRIELAAVLGWTATVPVAPCGDHPHDQHDACPGVPDLSPVACADVAPHGPHHDDGQPRPCPGVAPALPPVVVSRWRRIARRGRRIAAAFWARLPWVKHRTPLRPTDQILDPDTSEFFMEATR